MHTCLLTANHTTGSAHVHVLSSRMRSYVLILSLELSCYVLRYS